MNMLSLFSTAVLMTGGMLLCGAERELLSADNPAEWGGVVKVNKDFSRNGKTCYELSGRYPTELIYSEVFAIDPKKTYTLQGSFRTLDEKFPASGYMGLKMYDEKDRVIGFCHVYAHPDTDSKVVSAKKGDKYLIAAKNDAWSKVKASVVAFGAKKDLSDLPNFDLSPMVVKVEPVNDATMRVELKTPLKSDYPAGTAIRLHSPWSPSLYFLAQGWMPAKDGKTFTAKLRGISAQGTPSNQFWKGTKKVRVFVWFGNWDRIPTKEARLLVDGFSFKESD